MGTISKTVAASADDCSRLGTTDWFSKTAINIHLTYLGEAWCKGGARFLDIMIPKGALIVSADLKLYSNVDVPDQDVETNLKGEDADNAATFSTKADFDGRVRTTASVVWDLPAWVNLTQYTSSDIKNIIQEIIDRPGWASGNALVIFIETNDTAAQDILSVAYDQDPPSAPHLDVEYTDPQSEDLPAEFMIRHADAADLKATFTARHDGSAELFADFEIAQYEDLFVHFIVAQWQEDLLAKFIVRNKAPPITGSGTVLWLRLDEGSGTKADDSSGQDNDGQLVNAPAWVNGVFGEALDFAGTNERVDLPTAFDALTAATLTLWFKYSIIAADSVIFSDYKDDANRFNPYVRNSDKRLSSEIFLAGVSAFIISDDPVVAGNWYHAAFVLGAGGMKLYVNGVLQADTDPATTCFDDLAPAASVQVGQLNGGVPFKGTIDDVRIYDRELTSDEIMALYLNSDLPSEFAVRHESSTDLHADFLPRHASSADLLSALIVRNIGSQDLHCDFVVRHSVSILTIYEDDETFWTAHNWGVGAYALALSEELAIKEKGTSSLKMNVAAGAFAHCRAYHDYGAGHDWSAYDSLCFYFYGVNSGLSWQFKLHSKTFDGPDDFYYAFNDNIAGWRRFVVPLASMGTNGSPVLTDIRGVDVRVEGITATATSYLDQALLEIDDLHCDLTVRHSSSEEVFAEFGISQWEDLHADFVSRQASSVDLHCDFIVRHEAYIDLHVEFKPGIFWSGGPVAVPCEFTVRQSSSANLHADFTVIPAEDLKALFILRQEGAQDLKAEFISRQAGSADLHMGFRVATTWSGGPEDLFSKFVARHAATSDLHAEFVSRHASLIDLPSEFVSRHAYSIDLHADLIARHSATSDLKTKLIIRHSASLDLKAKFIVYHLGSAELVCEFIARQSGLQNLHADFTIRHSSTSDLKCGLWVRFPTRLWTNRRYLNGVIDVAEGLIGDAILEYVIEGVMEDIQGYLSTHDVSYDTWTDITLVPVLIRRATTYGVVASLYARHTKTFTSRVIPSVAPVTVTVIGDAERAMQYWEDRMEKRLEEYLASAGGIVMKSSTEDEEPVFSMEDIPSELDDFISWHEWLER